jgi:lipoprotein-releasing system permease protein
VILKGIRPAEERRLLEKRIRLHGGDWNDLVDGRKIMLGDDLASSLGVPVGGFVNLIVPQGGISPLGLMPRIRKFQVIGVFHTGLYDLDHNWAYIDLAEAQRLAAIPSNTVQCLEVRTDEIYEVAAMEALLDERLHGRAVYTNWIEKNQAFFSALTLEKWSMFLAIGLIVLVAALNIITTLIMMVMEKNKDIAILRAMGATGRQIMGIFMWQGLMIGIIGAVLGSTMGVGLSWAADKYQWISLDAEVYMIAHLPFRLNPWDVLLVACSAVIVSFLATLYPSRQAARIDPVEVIRYG